MSHTFTERTNYTINEKAKDIEGHEGKKQPLKIAMPYSYILLWWFWGKFFERFPNASPILRYIFGY